MFVGKTFVKGVLPRPSRVFTWSFPSPYIERDGSKVLNVTLSRKTLEVLPISHDYPTTREHVGDGDLRRDVTTRLM